MGVFTSRRAGGARAQTGSSRTSPGRTSPSLKKGLYGRFRLLIVNICQHL